MWQRPEAPQPLVEGVLSGLVGWVTARTAVTNHVFVVSVCEWHGRKNCVTLGTQGQREEMYSLESNSSAKTAVPDSRCALANGHKPRGCKQRRTIVLLSAGTKSTLGLPGLKPVSAGMAPEVLEENLFPGLAQLPEASAFLGRCPSCIFKASCMAAPRRPLLLCAVSAPVMTLGPPGESRPLSLF